MITMLLGGLWHGGAWTFVIWGGLHGLALIMHRAWGAWRRSRNGKPLPYAVSWPLTIYSVCVAWIFFRAGSLHDALVVARSFIFFRDAGDEKLGAWLLLAVVSLAVVHAISYRGYFAGWWRRGPAPAFAAGYGFSAAIVLLFVPPHYKPFIYFQF
jgi:D-alanyl-lipoteichoic acid acyltransferase DltB (MBOAT superfamily)